MMSFLFDDLKPRIIASLLFLLVLFGALYTTTHETFRLLFPLVLSLITMLAIFEYLQMAKNQGLNPPFWLICVGTLCYNLAIFKKAVTEESDLFTYTVLGLIFVSLFLWYFLRDKNPLLNLAVSIFSLAYLAIPLSSATEIVFFKGQDGRFPLLFVLAVTKMGDIAAYFFGKQYGKHPLTPYISPKKTWEGAFAALFASLITGCIFFGINHLIFATPKPPITLFQTVSLSIFIALFALFGDLAESLLKRDSGLKDSSKIPGMGGILDTVDSLVFTLPIMYIFLTIVS